MQKVVIYTGQHCPYCTKAKSFLSEKGIEYQEMDVTDDPDMRARVASETGWMTIPMIFVGDEFVGGFQELEELDAGGELDRKVNA